MRDRPSTVDETPRDYFIFSGSDRGRGGAGRVCIVDIPSMKLNPSAANCAAQDFSRSRRGKSLFPAREPCPGAGCWPGLFSPRCRKIGVAGRLAALRRPSVPRPEGCETIAIDDSPRLGGRAAEGGRGGVSPAGAPPGPEAAWRATALKLQAAEPRPLAWRPLPRGRSARNFMRWGMRLGGQRTGSHSGRSSTSVDRWGEPTGLRADDANAQTRTCPRLARLAEVWGKRSTRARRAGDNRRV